MQMLTPGFIITNETLYPLQISLNQVSPLYYDVIKPGESFVRTTGSVWFTIKAAVFLDEKERITTWDAVWPIGMLAGTVLLAAATAGAAAYAAGPAIAAAGEATGMFAGAGLSASAMTAVAAASQTLVGAGFSAGASLVISGAVIGGTASAVTETIAAGLNDIFSKKNTVASLAGCYAGPAWPFRHNITPWRITGGPTYGKTSDKQVVMSGQTLKIER